MEVVNKYMYLGLYFSTKFRFNATVPDLFGKAKNAIMRVYSAYARKPAAETFCKII